MRQSGAVKDSLGFGYPATYDPATVASAGIAANQIFYVGRVLGSGRISKLRVFNTVSSGNLRVACWAGTGAGLARTPGPLKGSSAITAVAAAGSQDVALTATIDALEGDYFGLAYDNGTARFMGLNNATFHTTWASRSGFMATAALAVPDPFVLSLYAICPLIVGVP